MVEPTAFNLLGIMPADPGTTITDANGVGITGFRKTAHFRELEMVCDIWSNGVEHLKLKSLAEDASRVLPSELANDDNLLQYVHCYMAIVALCQELTSWIKCRVTDPAHYKPGFHASKVGITRFKMFMEYMSTVPCWTPFFEYAQHSFAPVYYREEGIVHHRVWDPFISHKCGPIPNAASSMVFRTANLTDGHKMQFHAMDDDGFKKILEVAEELATYFGFTDPSSTTNRLSGENSDMVSDFRKLRDFFEILKIPTNTFSFDAFPALVQSKKLLDMRLNRGVLVHGRGGTNAAIDRAGFYPGIEDNESFVEVRGIDNPDVAELNGLAFPYAAATFTNTEKVGTTNRVITDKKGGLDDDFKDIVQFGCIMSSGLRSWGPTALRQPIRGASIYTREDGWKLGGINVGDKRASLIFSVETTLKNDSLAPFFKHQYLSTVLGPESADIASFEADTSDILASNHDDDYDFMVPIRHFPFRLLAWTSAVLGVPHRVGG
jgi:hypothetical protein